MIELDKRIYNAYLVSMRQSQDKPFTIRKDFTKFEESKEYPFVRRIRNVFNKFPHIKMMDYFRAPYEVYPNDKEQVYFLDFYASLKAISCYKQFMKLKELKSPDDPEQLQFITESFRFMLKFCSEKHILFEEYLDYKVGFTPEWMKHYVEHNISIYSLLDIPNIYDMIMGIEADHRKLLLGDLEDRFYTMKESYLKSKKAKLLVKRGTELLHQQTKQINKNNTGETKHG
jgi:hypothetical protein